MNNKQKALITGITGQDGSYLAEFLLEKGYEVHGIVRRSSTFNRHNINHIFDTPEKREKYLHYGDMVDINSLIAILEKVKPDEIYNLAAQSHVQVSFKMPNYTTDCDASGVLNLLEAIKILGLDTKFYQASTSEMYGGNKENMPQNENTQFKPRSPYGVAKLYGFEISRVYRESYDMFICNGILFNHESPRRGFNFLTKKVAAGVAKIQRGEKDRIYLGNLEAKRDWGYAPEYVKAMWQMLQQDKPDDYVVATGDTNSVREFVEAAFDAVNVTIKWRGKDEEEVGVNTESGEIIVEINSDYYRPNEVDFLCGDASKAEEKLGWKPEINFEDLADIMVNNELNKSVDQPHKLLWK